METLKLKIIGSAPFIMHSNRGVNQLDPMTQAHKKLTSNRKKTDDIHAQIARSEYEMGFYFDKELGPFVPTRNIRKAIIEGARLNKLGTVVEEATLILEPKAPLKYKGPREIQSLWDDGNFLHACAMGLSTNGGSVMRYRPMFPGWSVSVELEFDEERIERAALVEAAQKAGRYKGLGDSRPEFGRFNVEVQ